MEQIYQFIINHWALCLAFVGIILLIYINEWFTKSNGPKTLTPQFAVEKINHEDAVVIDLRDQEAFAAGHIINALRAGADDFDLPRMDKYKLKPVILVCSRGIQAQTLASKLKSKGFMNAMVLAGGLSAWQSAGLPLVKGNK
jgi:rhodanese-related sulfurtransferase